MAKKSAFQTRVDNAMEKASAGLQIPLSKLVAMGKLCGQALGADPSMNNEALVAKCRAIMIQQGATEV